MGGKETISNDKKTSQTEKVHLGWKFKGGGNVLGIDIIRLERFECNN